MRATTLTGVAAALVALIWMMSFRFGETSLFVPRADAPMHVAAAATPHGAG